MQRRPRHAGRRRAAARCCACRRGALVRVAPGRQRAPAASCARAARRQQSAHARGRCKARCAPRRRTCPKSFALAIGGRGFASARSMLAIFRERTRSGSAASRGGCKSASAQPLFFGRRCRGPRAGGAGGPAQLRAPLQSAYAAPSSHLRVGTAVTMPPLPTVPSGSRLGCTARLLGYAFALTAATAASTVSLAKSHTATGPPAELLDVLDSE